MRDDVVNTRDTILLAALDDVPFDGWSWSVVQEASVKAGLKAETADAVFPEKLNDVLIHFADWADRQMLSALEALNPDEMRVRDRVAKAVEVRLRALEPHKDCVRASAGYWARPFKKMEAAKLIWRTSDKIWAWAGDTATDYNKYSKRGLLSGVITSTMLYWLNDKSDNMDDTLAFLGRRIDNVLRFGKITGGIVSKVQSGLGRFKQQ